MCACVCMCLYVCILESMLRHLQIYRSRKRVDKIACKACRCISTGNRNNLFTRLQHELCNH